MKPDPDQTAAPSSPFMEELERVRAERTAEAAEVQRLRHTHETAERIRYLMDEVARLQAEVVAARRLGREEGIKAGIDAAAEECASKGGWRDWPQHMAQSDCAAAAQTLENRIRAIDQKIISRLLETP